MIRTLNLPFTRGTLYPIGATEAYSVSEKFKNKKYLFLKILKLRAALLRIELVEVNLFRIESVEPVKWNDSGVVIVKLFYS